MRHLKGTICLFSALTLLTLAGCSAGYSKDTWGPSPEPMVMNEAPRPDNAPQISPPLGDTPASGTWKRSTLPSNATRLMIGETESLPLKGATAHATIDGPRARVVLELTFDNPHGRQLEGTFQLRLPPGASPYYLAFGQTLMRSPNRFSDAPGGWLSTEALRADLEEAGESVIEARVVQRDKAAHAYREITQVRRTDPALMEWAGAGVFKTRLFPILPNQTHRVIIGYDLDLIQSEGALSMELALPKAAERVAHVAVRDIPGGFETRLTPNVPATDLGNGYKGYTWGNEESARLEVKLEGISQNIVLQDEHKGVGALFTTRFVPGIPKIKASNNRGPAVFLVDTSFSSHPERFEIWLKLMKAILDNNRGAIDQFAVLFFDVTGHWWKPAFAQNTPEQVEALMAHANSLSLEGATNLTGALAEASRPAWLKAGREGGHTFLMSDGAATWGDLDTDAMAETLSAKASGPLFAYQTGLEGTSTRILSALARQSGGAVFSVTGEGAIEEASRAHLALPWSLEAIAVEGGRDLLLSGRPETIYPGQRLLLAGRGAPRSGTRVSLSLRSPSGEKVVVQHPLGAVMKSALASRHYGQIAVGHLEALQPVHRATATAFARHFRVPGKNVSLLMMETEQDYANYGIKPEQDIAQVEGTLVTGLVEPKASAGRARQAFLDQMVHLSETPGLTFAWSGPHRDLIEALPAEAFEVTTPLLFTEALKKKDLSAAYAAYLADPTQDEALWSELDAKEPKSALRSMSNLVENAPGDAAILRGVGLKALALGQPAQAYHLFWRASQIQPFVPQGYLAMAQCLDEMGRADLAMAWYEAITATQWNNRFGAVAQVARVEYVRLLRRIEAGLARSTRQKQAAEALARLSPSVTVSTGGLVMTSQWNTDGTDVHVHIHEPSGEEAMWSHNRTKSGGALTQDVTQGYGPEMYTSNEPHAGLYKLDYDYYWSDRNRVSTRTMILLTAYDGWATANERITRRFVVMDLDRQTKDAGTLTLDH